jgi:hypothetical protein
MPRPFAAINRQSSLLFIWGTSAFTIDGWQFSKLSMIAAAGRLFSGERTAAARHRNRA